MKQVITRAFVIIGSVLLLFSCSKANLDLNQGTNNPSKSGKPITISATLTDALTKVAFTPGLDGANHPKMVLTWESTDKLRVANHEDHNSYSDFNLVSGAGSKEGVFTGTPVAASSYDIWVLHQGDEAVLAATQTQASEGSTGHIKYVAQANSVTDLGALVFTDISSVLGLKAKLPTDVATTITSVELTASNDIFYSGKTLTINLTNASGAVDDVLNLYATLPSGTQAIPNGTTLLVKFHSNVSHSVYTRYVEFPDGKSFASGCLNHLQINCVNTDKYAGKDDNGTSSHPYLIADPFQLAALNTLLPAASAGTTVYAELINDIDLSVFANWTPIDASTRYIHFEGNNNKVSNLAITSGTYCGLFSILYGTVQNLTIENASISGVSKASGILAGYICSNNGYSIGCTIDNVTISGTNSLNGGSQYCGAIAGVIGKHKTNTFPVSISNIEISGLTVTSSQSCGGLLGYTQYETCTNRTLSIDEVDIINSSIATTGAGKCVGGLIGVLDDPSADIDNIDIKGTNVSGLTKALAVGGIVGQVTAAADFDACTYEKNDPTTATVTGPTQHNGGESTAGSYIGGIVGEVSGAASFDDCHVKNATVTFTTPNSNTSYWKYTGGAFGYIHNASATVGATDGCSVESTTVTAHHYSGGFVGFIDGGSISNCAITGLSYSGWNYSGGFVGQIDSGSISSCTVAGNTVQSANATVGGFAGMINGGSLDACSTSLQMGDADHKMGGNLGGFVGRVTADVTIEDCHSSGNVFSSGGTVGGFSGDITNGTFTSCSSLGDVTASGYMGGFVGVSQTNAASFTDCTVGDASHNPSITQTAGAGNYFTGGFIGNCQIGSSFSNCDVKATIVMPANAIKGVGGFVGHTVTGRPSFTNCDVLSGSAVNAKANWVGGFAGYSQIGGTFNTCTSAANVTATEGSAQYIGGFVGYADGADTTEDVFVNCGVTGTVSGYQHVGGFVGIANGETFTNCYFEGPSVSSNYSGKSAFLGGFCGDTPNTSNGIATKFEGCHVGDGVNTVSVSSSSGQRVGGFIGQNYNPIGDKCFVQKTAVNGATNTGGFVGVQYANIEKCYVEGGTVTSMSGGNTGGFSAFMQNCTLNDSYSTAAVDGASYNTVGGLVGVTNSGISINRCYAMGTVTGTGSNKGGLIGSLVSGATADKCIAWNSSLPLAGNDAGTNTNNYVKEASEVGTISSHAKESPRSWSADVWNWNDSGSDPLNRPTLK